MPKTLHDEWVQYRNACYPCGVPKAQEIECHQAFFAGALVVLKLATDNAHGLSDEAAYAEVVKVINEAETVCRNRVYAAKGRN